MSTAITTTDGGRAATQVYPECRQVQNDDLDHALRRLWNTLCEVPADEMERRRETADRIAAAAAEYEATRRRRKAGPVPVPHEHVGFMEAFDNAVAAATGLQRREAARLTAKATVRFLVEHADGRTIERLTGIYTRFGSAVSRAEGAVLAGELEVGTGQVRDPLGLLHFRCQRAAEVAP